ncbi:calcium-binding protein [Streptomyces sp. NPDC047000]|uniref:calcium-binding protein n=1 Tax=Streptomyces sp. NPDC047000 TaxID=3155474 RepID=UPI003408A28B
MPSRLGRRRLFHAVSVLALVLGAGLALPMVLASTRGGPVAPATAEVFQELVYRAAPGQDNSVTITQTGTTNRTDPPSYVIDDVVPIIARSGCTHPDAADRTKVSCTVPPEDASMDVPATLVMWLGDGDDTATVHTGAGIVNGHNEIHLGSGKDTWTGTAQEGLLIWGDAGDDTITSSEGGTIDGGPGDDTLYAGNEVLAVGGPGDDKIHGGAGSQILTGGLGDDVIYGGPGDDVIYGSEGDDVMYGNSGDDTMWGESKALTRGEKFGKRRDDKLYGGPGRDTLDGGPGTDTVLQD